MESELIGAPKPILYNFKELSENAEYERENNVIGKERIDRSTEKKTFEELIDIVDPAIPEEHRIIIKEHLETDSLRG